MRIAVLGGGPAGLYFAYLWKRRHPADAVRLIEQNPADATFGFGVVFSAEALEFLRGDDPETCDLIAPHMEAWRDITLVQGGARTVIDGIGFSAIDRLALLRLLQERVRAVGIEPEFGRAVRSLDELGEADLIVGADGLNSPVRRSYEGDFATSLAYLGNKFVWYGTRRLFDTLTQTFVESEHGAFTAHHYRYSPRMSTFLIECDRATWLRAGLDGAGEEASRAYCERVFAEALGGERLVSNRSLWRNFPQLANGRWWFRNMVLLGDALHTAHFSIGSGTRLALEDAIALARALEAEPSDLAAGLARYEAARRPVVEKLVAAATASARWYERFPEHMRLAPLDFAYSYITRSGRIGDDRLRALSPGFMAAYEWSRRHIAIPPLPSGGEGRGEGA